MKCSLLVLFLFYSIIASAQKNKLLLSLSKANCAYEKQDYQKAKKYYLKVLTVDSMYAKAYVQLTNIACENQQFDVALTTINKAISIEKATERNESELAYMYSIRSFCYFNLDKPEESLKDISTAIALNTENGSYYFMRSLMKRMNGDIKGCCQDLKKSLELGNSSASEYMSIYCLK